MSWSMKKSGKVRVLFSDFWSEPCSMNIHVVTENALSLFDEHVEIENMSTRR